MKGGLLAISVSSPRPSEWLQPLHSSRRDLEPSVRQALIGYVGFAASISAAPPAAVGRSLASRFAKVALRNLSSESTMLVS